MLEFVTPTLVARAHASFDIDALTGRICQLSFRGPHDRRLGPFVSRLSRGHHHVQWMWTVPAGVTPGRWHVVAACAGSRAALKHHDGTLSEPLVVRGSRRQNRGSIVAKHSLSVHATIAAPSGRAAASGGKVVGLGGGHNPFPYGQCTYHAYEARADVYDYAVAHGVPRGGAATGASFGGIPDYWWNAWRWLSNAQRVGIPTGGTPVVGALVVFPRGYGGSPVGHIAYVESVNPDGTYVVSERNWNYNHNVSNRLVHPGYPGVGFIYGGPAGNGPAPPPAAPTTPAPTPPPTTPTTPTTTTSGGTTTTTTPAPTFYVHHVQGTCADGACGLHERTGPGYSNYASTRVLYDGNELDIVCQSRGQFVTPNHGTGSDVWDKLTDGGYVTDVYVDTSGVGGNFSPPIPQC